MRNIEVALLSYGRRFHNTLNVPYPESDLEHNHT